MEGFINQLNAIAGRQQEILLNVSISTEDVDVGLLCESPWLLRGV